MKLYNQAALCAFRDIQCLGNCYLEQVCGKEWKEHQHLLQDGDGPESGRLAWQCWTQFLEQGFNGCPIQVELFQAHHVRVLQHDDVLTVELGTAPLAAALCHPDI